jgi:hypothetical protein
MDQEAIQQIIDEVLSSFEPLEAQSAAVVQFLKAKGLANDEEFAPFLEQAANAANVRWRAVRVRTAALIAHAMKPEEAPSATQGTEGEDTKNQKSESGRKEDGQQAETKAKPDQSSDDTSQNQKADKTSKGNEKRVTDSDHPEASAKSRGDEASEATEESLKNSELSNPPLIKTQKNKNEQSSAAG